MTDRQAMLKDLERAPVELEELIAHWMIEVGPSGECDGHEIISAKVWEWVRQSGEILSDTVGPAPGPGRPEDIE